MVEILNFLDIGAWICAILSTLLLVARIIGALTYSEEDFARDVLLGYVRTFPITAPAVVAVWSWSWIVARSFV